VAAQADGRGCDRGPLPRLPSGQAPELDERHALLQRQDDPGGDAAVRAEEAGASCSSPPRTGAPRRRRRPPGRAPRGPARLTRTPMGPSYQHKIKNRRRAREAIGPRPRARSVIHVPRRLRHRPPRSPPHLMYAKGKADLLIASLTADEHILKADHRPYVPQELRAANLAPRDGRLRDHRRQPDADREHPRLQPDYFAKATSTSPRASRRAHRRRSTRSTSTARDGLHARDIVYSSSRLIEAHAPRIPVEKLLALMESEGVDFADLRKVLRGWPGCGCTSSATRSSTPTATAPPRRRAEVSDLQRPTRALGLFTGGAGGVARHVKAAGATVSFSTVLGEDELKPSRCGNSTRRASTAGPSSTGRAPPPGRSGSSPTGTRCSRSTGSTTGRYRSASPGPVRRAPRHPRRRRGLQRLPARHLQPPDDLSVHTGHPATALKVADSQVSNRWGNILDFTDFDLLTPNEREARFALADQDSVVRRWRPSCSARPDAGT